MSNLVKVVYVGQDDTDVPDLGTWKSGEVKDVDASTAEWLRFNSDLFRLWEPAPDDGVKPNKAKPVKSEDGTE